MTIIEEFKSIELSPKKLREFGLLVGGIFLALSALLFWKGRPAAPYFLAIGSPLVILGAVWPGILKYLYLGWMGLAVIMGWFVSRILLSVLFFIAVTPIGLIIRFTGKDLLDTKFKDGKDSYWILREDGIGQKEDYEKQF